MTSVFGAHDWPPSVDFPAAEWRVLLRDHHAAYISWEVYERNQAIIAHNAQMKGLMVRGAVRRGPRLLRCAHCGRRLHVSYSGRGGGVPRYASRGAAINHGAGRCISFGGLRVDASVEQEVLRVLTPGAIEAALATPASTVEQTTATHRGGVGAARSAVRGRARPAPV
jgi:hypothetical protein